MRVSNYELTGWPQFHMGAIQEEMLKKQIQVSTGRAFQSVSEDPLKANQAMLIEQSQGHIAQFQKNITDANGFLSMTEGAVAGAIELLQSAKDNGLRGANGTSSASDRQTFAGIVESNIQQLETLANTKYLGKYIFSGEKTQTQAFTYPKGGAAATYNGDASAIQFDVSSTSKVQVSETGNTAFAASFAALINLRDQLNSGGNIAGALGQLDTAMDAVTDLRSDIGTRMTMLDSMNNVYQKTSTDLKAKIANVEGVDFPTALTEFTNAQRAYQGLLQSSVKMTQVSILNYI